MTGNSTTSPWTVTDYVLNVIADDYESWFMILKEVRRMSKEYRVTVRRTEILSALERIVTTGLARAYVLSSTQPYATVVDWNGDRFRELYYYVTPEGAHLVRGRLS
jgi:hypothetical protein